MDSNQLRRRRARIIHDKAREEREDEELRALLKKTQGQSGQAFKTLILTITAIVVFVFGVIQYTQPGFFGRLINGRRGSIPTFYFATKYPPDVILERDLPRFFRTYSIASPENEFAQEAVRKIQRSRTQLKRRAGIIKTIVKAWDETNIQHLIHRGICGADWEEAYDRGSSMRKNDLLMWCLLASRIAEGFFQESVEFIDTALFLLRQRGMIVKKISSGSIDTDGQGNIYQPTLLSSSYYLHPRTNTTEVEWIPTKVLSWIIANPEEKLGTPEESRQLLQRVLYDMVIQSGHEDDFVVLDEVCQDQRPNRSIAIDCPNGEEIDCCYFVVPEKYGGRIISSVEEDEN